MEIDDLDFVDDHVNGELEELNNLDLTEPSYLEESNDLLTEDDIISELLKLRGIEDRSKIKFENEDGEVEEVDWNSLSSVDKLNILDSSTQDPESDLDDNEIELINAIRQSRLSPLEYIQAIQKLSISNYVNQTLSNAHTYKVDEINDDDLYVMDMLSRTLDITEEEAFEALERAKQNETLFKKLIGAMRNDYKRIEDENLQYELLRMQEQLQAQYNVFTKNIEQSVVNFTELAGGKLDMDLDDMQELYDFITGFDTAGNSHFGKALNDPDTLVKMAWFALNGEDTIRSIENYYNKEITKAREEGYKKGLQKSKEDPQFVYRNKQKPNSKSEVFNDLDDI